jgi:hypothetical protein
LAQAKGQATLKAQLFNELKEQGAPRMFGRGAAFDQYGFASETWNNFTRNSNAAKRSAPAGYCPVTMRKKSWINTL